MNYKYDLVVIGSGPGGYVAAVRAAQLGLKVACVDKRAEPGGTCLNVGCIPSKSLLQSTELYNHLLKDGHEHGIVFTNLSIDFKEMSNRKKQVVSGLVEGVRGLFKQNGVIYIQGTANFIDPHTLEVTNDGQKQKIDAQYILLATGSEPIPLPNLPFDERQIVSSTGALSLSKVPQRMVVVGGGVIGVEIASVYNRLGTDITIVEMLDRICPAMDRTISLSLLQVLKKQGMKFLLSTKVVTTVVQPNEVILTVNQGEQLSNLSADVVLVAVGRRPYSQELGLDKVGVKLDSKGFVLTDEAFRTSLPHIFAIGDLINGVMLAHRASEEGVAVVELIANANPTKINYMTIPNVIYTNPEVASVGLTEEEAREAGLDVMIGSVPFKANARARCSGEMEGLIKIIGESKSGRVIGMHIIGPHASEIIAEGMIAIEKKATLHDLAYAPNAHPTLNEAIKEAAVKTLNAKKNAKSY